MSVQETLGEAFDKIADIQNDVSDMKDAMGKIEKNNPVIGDVEDSVETITKIVSDIKSHNYAELINDGIELGNELSKIPGDLKSFIDKKGGALLGDAGAIKEDVVKLITDIKEQFSTIVGDLKTGGIEGFVKAFQDLTKAIEDDIKTGKDIGDNVQKAVDTLEEAGDKVNKVELQKQEAKDQARDIGSHIGVTDVKDAGGKDGQQSPTTPGQDTGGQEMGI